MANTTTFAVIRDAYITRIELLTPGELAHTKFRRVQPRTELRPWALENPGTGILRRFEIRSIDGPRMLNPDVLAPDLYEVGHPAEIVVAYPVLPELYEKANQPNAKPGWDKLEDVMDADMRQLRDVFWSPAYFQTGQTSGVCEPDARDRSDETVWFQTLTIGLTYYTAQSIL